MPFLLPNQQCQSTKGIEQEHSNENKLHNIPVLDKWKLALTLNSTALTAFLPADYKFTAGQYRIQSADTNTVNTAI